MIYFGIIGLATLIVTSVQTQGVTYKSGKKTHRLVEVPNHYVVGFYESDRPAVQAKTSSVMKSIPAIVESRRVGKNLYVARTSGARTGLQSLRNVSEFDFVYPLYRCKECTNFIYPRPELIVRIRDNADISQIAKRYNLTVLRPLLYTEDQFVLRHDSRRNPFDISNSLHSDPQVIWSTPNIAKHYKKRFRPNDPLYTSQWHLNNTGQGGSKSGADVSAEEAWDLVRPDTNIVIAIVDDGVDIDHPDLKIWVNEAEANGTAGMDDDGNGLIDDINGWDFYNGDNQPIPKLLEDEDNNDNHGTAVAGVAAAKGDNGIGVTGAAYGVSVMPVKIFSGNDIVEDAKIADAFRYASVHADIISNSWGSGEELDDAISEALNFATSDRGKRGDKGIPVLFASGNEASEESKVKYKTDITIDSGPHSIVFEYDRDESGAGEDNIVTIYDATLWPLESGGEEYEIPFSGEFSENAISTDLYDVPFVEYVSYITLDSGSHTIVFEYDKDEAGSGGDDKVWVIDTTLWFPDYIDYIDIFPWEDAFPEGIRGEGDVPFKIVEFDEFTYVYESGDIDDSQSSRLVWEFDLLEDNDEYELSIDFFASTEKNSDFFRIYIDGEEVKDTFTTDELNYIDIFLWDDTFPPDVSTEGDKPFEIVELSEGEYVYESGNIGDGEVSRLVWEFDNQYDSIDYELELIFYASTEKDSDYFRIYIDGEEVKDTFSVGHEEFTIPFSGEFPENLNVAPLSGENLHPRVINIGASTDDDRRAEYSQWGPELHFVAPSSGGINGIVTTDVTGLGNGYDPDSDYTETEDSLFGGTSSSCPLASGIIAMVMSAYPGISMEEIMKVLKETSAKIGDKPYDDNGFNEWYGYGRLDMTAAVKYALELSDVSINSWEIY